VCEFDRFLPAARESQQELHRFSDELNPRKTKFVHIVNPYHPGNIPESEAITQELTFASMLEAKKYYNGEVSQVAVQFAEDKKIIPCDFICAPHLSRSVLDVCDFAHKKKLPLLFDILDKGSAFAGSDDFIVFTNVDICLKPYFYSIAAALVDIGFDGITINRRTVGALELYKENPILVNADIGSGHPGYDCFIFKKELYDRFVRNNACIGMHYVMRALLYNMVASAAHLLMLKNVDLTFHYGDDMTWQDMRFSDYKKHNEREACKSLKTLSLNETNYSTLEEFCLKNGEKYSPNMMHLP